RRRDVRARRGDAGSRVVGSRRAAGRRDPRQVRGRARRRGRVLPGAGQRSAAGAPARVASRQRDPVGRGDRDPGAAPAGAGRPRRLGVVAGDAAALALAERYLVQRLTGADTANAWAASGLLAALDLYLHSKVLVVTEGTGRDELLAAARRAYAPTLCIAGPWAA